MPKDKLDSAAATHLEADVRAYSGKHRRSEGVATFLRVLVWIGFMLVVFLIECHVQKHRTERTSYPTPPDPEQRW